MNKRINQETAFTLIELVVILFTIAVLLALTFSGLPRTKERARRNHCKQNLKQVGLAFRQWEMDGDRLATQVPNNVGGAQQSMTNGEMFRVFEVMSNQLHTPKILVCPADTRTPAPSFVALLSNTNVSYFVGMDADEVYPMMFLSGDHNLEVDGVAAKPGIVTLRSNNVVGWTREIHKLRGNVGFTDGHVQAFDKQQFNEVLTQTGVSTNRLVIP